MKVELYCTYCGQPMFEGPTCSSCGRKSPYWEVRDWIPVDQYAPDPGLGKGSRSGGATQVGPEDDTIKTDSDPADAATRMVDNEVTVCPYGLTIDVTTIPPLASLEVIRPRGVTSTYRLCEGVYRMGAGRDIQVPIPDPGVTGLHASITAKYLDKKVSLWLEDHDSLAGTLVNGKRITKHEIQPRDEIRIGGTKLRCKILVS